MIIFRNPQATIYVGRIMPGHLPHPALHHPLAHLIHRQADRRLAGRSRLLPGPVHGTNTDNPDQRIQLDVDVFTTGGWPAQPTPGKHRQYAAVPGPSRAVSTVVSFVPILWSLSGPLTLFGITRTTPCSGSLRLRLLRHGRCVLDRPAAHQAPASAADRPTPHSATHWSGCVLTPRGGRVLPRRECRTLPC